jgi:membrane associated rhomboid family serine protease
MSELEAIMIYLAWGVDFLLSLVFLLPVKDDRGRHRSFPTMTVGIIVLNTLVFALVNVVLFLRVGDPDVWLQQVKPFLLVPADVVEGKGLGALSVITSTFLHADLSHLVYNMLFLFFFGRKLEDVLGPTKFGLLYLACAFVSSLGSIVQEMLKLSVTQGTVPELGASGAIMGIVAAYLFLFPGQRIRTMPVLFWVVLLGIPLPIPLPIPVMIPMPAWVFILYSVLKDIAHGWLQTKAQEYGFVYSLAGSFAHLGGIIAGLTCLYFFLPAEILHYRHRLGEET